MDEKKISALAVQATSSLSGVQINLSNCNPYSARIQVISDDFEPMNLTERFEKLYELFYAPSGAVPRTFAIEFEAWTHAEFEQIKKTKGNVGESSSGGGESEEKRRKIAAPGSDPYFPNS